MTAIARRCGAISPELQDSFQFEFQTALDLIKKHGTRFAPVQRDIRAVRVQRFPYEIYYRLIGDGVRILVVKHLHRAPDFGLDRD